MSIYLLIADVITALQNEAEGNPIELETIVEGLAEAFSDYDPHFNKVQFLADCELAESA
jgi:hypothetical protein